MYSRALVLVALAAAARAQAPPDSDEQTRILAGIHEAARAYVKNLPDFICLQTTHRDVTLAPSDALSSVRESGSRSNLSHISAPRGQASDTYEEQLTYFDGQEKYQLLTVNGKRQKPGQSRPPGLTSEGEFATTLSGIFDQQSQTQFEWKRWDTLRGEPVMVFAFRVDQAHSAAKLDVPSSSAIVGYHGLIYAHRDSKIVLRLTTEAESPKDFPLQNVTHLLDYGQVEIASQRFVLPLHAEMQTRMSEDFMRYGREGGNSKQVFLTNRVDFRGYRKYTAESELKADPEKH